MNSWPPPFLPHRGEKRKALETRIEESDAEFRNSGDAQLFGETREPYCYCSDPRNELYVHCS